MRIVSKPWRAVSNIDPQDSPCLVTPTAVSLVAEQGYAAQWRRRSVGAVGNEEFPSQDAELLSRWVKRRDPTFIMTSPRASYRYVRDLTCSRASRDMRSGAEYGSAEAVDSALAAAIPRFASVFPKPLSTKKVTPGGVEPPSSAQNPWENGLSWIERSAPSAGLRDQCGAWPRCGTICRRECGPASSPWSRVWWGRDNSRQLG